jgi:hypothetical protein
MKSIITKLIFFAFILLSGCINAPNFSDTPEIKFIGFSKSILAQGDINNDSTSIFLEFTDGDGDIGTPGNGNTLNLFVIDNRNGAIYDNIKLPQIPQEGANNGVKGTITVKLFNGCCLFDDKPNCTVIPSESNEFTLDVYLIDNAGNQSNTITTTPLTFVCS